MGPRVAGPRPERGRRRFQLFRREGESIASVVAFPVYASSIISGQLSFDKEDRETGARFPRNEALGLKRDLHRSPEDLLSRTRTPAAPHRLALSVTDEISQVCAQ